jgi:outer membrane protein assembly factor BamE (lipoprotein component of BamABCDE complex)
MGTGADLFDSYGRTAMRVIAASLACLLAAACAVFDARSLQPGTPEAQVRAAMGTPALDLPSPDGSRRLVYPKGPLGTQTFMADVDGNGALIGVHQALTDDVFNGIRPGMTRDDILRRIGPPGETMRFAGTQTESWDYRYHDTWGYLAMFSVIFDRNGIVVSKFTQRLERDRNKS